MCSKAASITITLIVCFVFTEIGQAQVLNVERLRGADDLDPGWVGELRFDAALNKYRDQIFRLGNQTNVGYYSGNHAYLLLNSINLVNIDGSSVVSTGHIHARGTFFRMRSWSPELFAQFQYNANLGLKGRYLAGGGVRYMFLDSDEIRGHMGSGIMFERERWEQEDNTIIEKNLVKSTTNLVVRGQINPQTQLLMIGYYQARPDQFLQPRIISENQLNLRMTNRVTFAVNFTLSYDFNPVADVPELTYELTNGIVISL